MGVPHFGDTDLVSWLLIHYKVQIVNNDMAAIVLAVALWQPCQQVRIMVI